MQDKDKRECLRRNASGHVHGLKDQSKHKTKKTKKQNFEETFWFSLKRWFSFCFFWVLKCKNKKNLYFFWRNSPKKSVFRFLHFKTKKKRKKTQGRKKKHLLRLNQKVSSKFCFFGFWFWGFGVIVILYILQAFRYTKIKNRVYIIYVCVSYIYVCVLKDMIQEALRWISGGVPYIYPKEHVHKYIYIYWYAYIHMHVLLVKIKANPKIDLP